MAGRPDLYLVVGGFLELVLRGLVADEGNAEGLEAEAGGGQVNGVFQRFDVGVADGLAVVEAFGGVAPFEGGDDCGHWEF